MNKLELVANFTLATLFGAIAGILGLVLYLSGMKGFSAILSAFLFTGILGFLQWYFSPTIIRWITGAKEIEKEQAPKIFEIVSRLSKKAGIPMPKILVVNSPVPNAFAFGRGRKDSNVAVHSGLVKVLSQEELEAVLAHEIGHIKHRDVVIMTVASLIPVLLYYVAVILLSGSSDRREGRNSLAVFAGGILARFLGQLLVLWLSRTREFAADEFAARNSSGKALARGLAKISYGLTNGGVDDSLACLYIADNTGEDPETLANYLEMDVKSLAEAMRKESALSFLQIFMTHPRTSQRILALKRLEN